MEWELITANLAGSVRREQLMGRDYLVAPLTLIVPGVLNGSQGPLYYPPEEIAKNASAWNGMPIVVYHPRRDGRDVSARDPEVLNRSGIGTVLRAKVDGKLTAEGWFDIRQTRRVDNRVLHMLEAGRAGEISTGLYTRNEPVENGEHDGRKYVAIARDYRPDHLAILPDQKGACSVDDGCGLNVNADNLPASAYAYAPDPDKPSTWKLRIDDAAHVGGAVAAIGKGFRGNKVSIPEKDLPAVKKKIKAAWLKFHKDKSAEDLPAILRNSRRKTMNEKQRKELIDSLVTNSCCWEEEDRETLNEFSDKKLTALKGQIDKETELTANIKKTKKELDDLKKKKTTEEDDDEKAKFPPTKNQEAVDLKPQTAEEWLAAAPKEIQDDLQFARNEKAKQRQSLVDRLVANVKEEARDAYAKRIQTFDLGALQDLALAIPEEKPATNWEGAAGAPVYNRKPSDNLVRMGLPGEY